MVWVTITVVIEKRKHFRILFYSNHVVYESVMAAVFARGIIFQGKRSMGAIFGKLD